jgi:multiple sugar transport system substrate-binding protein
MNETWDLDRLLNREMTRRNFLQRGAALSVSVSGAAALLASRSIAPAAAGPAPSGRRVTMAYDAVDFWQDQGKDFTETTGIEFKYEAVPFPQLHDRYLASFMAGGREFDVVHVRDDWVAEWAPKGWLEPLDARLTDAIKREHFPAAFNYLSYKGKIYGVPRYIWLWQFYYNTEMFQKAGIKDPPKTWAEMREMAQKLTKPPQYGFIAPFGGTLSVNVFTVAIRAEGGEFMRGGQPTFNTPEGVRALNNLVGLVKDKSLDPSSFELNTTTTMTDIFTQGGVAMVLSTPPTLALAADPSKSRVAGKIAVALIPGGKLRSAGYSELGGIAIVAASPNKDAAWEYVKFVTNAEQQRKMAVAIGRIPTQPALLRDPEVQKKYPAAPLAIDQMKYPMGMAIVVAQQAEINTAVANELVAVLRGQKGVERALEDAEKATVRILKG